MQNLDLKKIIIFIVLPLLIIIGYFVVPVFWGNDESTSLEGVSSFLPFSEDGGGVSREERIRTSTSTETGKDSMDNAPVPLLRKITSTPVAGAIVFSQAENINGETKEIEKIRYIEKATGHIYETETNSLTQTRISNTTIPQIQEALWLDSQSLLIRYLDEDNNIKTFSAKIVTNDLGNQSLEGVFLQDNIQQIIKIGEKIFYLLEKGSGSIGVIADKQDKNKKIIFTSPLKEWLITPIDNTHISFTTKPAINIDGYSFVFNTKTYAFNKILGEKPNLSVLANSSSKLLYSEYEKGGPLLKLFNKSDRTETYLSVSTFPEKCVWGEENIYIYCGVPTEEISNYALTKWYQGTTAFSDNLWKINTKTKKEEFLISPLDNLGVMVDVSQPQINTENDYLTFINKKDLSLWGLKLKKDLTTIE